MSIRLPLQTVLNFTSTATTTDSQTVILPQDTDNIVVKLTATTLDGTNPTCDAYIQTSDDGGTTWYDMGNVGQITGAVVNQNARWGFFSVNSSAKRTQGASVLDMGAAAASTIGSSAYTGLPLLGRNLRVYLKFGGTQLSTNVTVKVYANSQSATA